MPRPRPASAPKMVAKLDVAAVSEPSPASDASAISPELQIMKPEPAPPMPKPRPVKAHRGVAKLDAAVVSEPSPQSDAATAAPDVQVAKLDPAAVPLPQPKPVLDVAPEDEPKQARRKSQRHTRVVRQKAQPQESGLVTFWRNLTTPQQPARRRR